MRERSQIALERMKTSGRHSTGRKGLYLFIEPTGAKRWVLRVAVAGRRRDFGLGSFDDVPLATASSLAKRYREWIAAGINPVAAWEAEKAATNVPTFRKAAEQVLAEREQIKGNEKHARQWADTLKQHVFPVIGDTPVDRIDTALLHEVLAPIWLRIPETARRVKQRIGVVLDWAEVKKFRSGDNPIHKVSKGLPKQPKRDGHFTALPYTEVADFLGAVRSCTSGPMARLALEFLTLTACRTNEVLEARWPEFDLDKKTWTIPAERMKAGKEHVVPLSSRAVEIMQAVKAINSGRNEVVFESNPGRGFSNMVFLKLLDTIGYRSKTTTHGLRSTFRDWAGETTGHPSDVIEKALAHTNKDKVEAAYQRGDLLEKRRKLMEDWARYCCPVDAKVIPLHLRLTS